MKNQELRGIPAVERVLQALPATDIPRPAVAALVRRELAALRQTNDIPEFEAVLDRIRSALAQLRRGKIQPVINGTGILAHTNLGRSPLGREVVETLGMMAAHYSNLEYDLNSGERGGRASYLEHNLALLCGAEAATVVNNCAAALVLILRYFTKERREVIISRSELVQIGGGFRIPEILEASGAKLKEVGATNKTMREDFRRAIGPATGLILKVHQSNFFMGGFVESPGAEEISALAREHGLAFVEDLGSGAVVATEKISGIEHEPTPAEVLKRGVDVVCFSGDKLLGGPQAGVIAGKKTEIGALKKEPFFRALRCDKLILGALQTTVDIYLNGAASGRAFPNVPILSMLEIPEEQLKARAEALRQRLAGLPGTAALGKGAGQIGGGTLPRSVIGSITLDLVPEGISLEQLSERLRWAEPAVIGYISGGKFKIDLRTVFPGQDDLLGKTLARALTG